MSLSYLQEELRMKRPVYSNRGREYECKWCPAPFSRKEDLDSHLQEGNHLIKFYCRCCDQMLDFKRIELVHQHVKARRGRDTFVNCRSPKSPGFFTSDGDLKKVKEEVITYGLKLGREEMWKNHLEKERLLKMK